MTNESIKDSSYMSNFPKQESNDNDIKSNDAVLLARGVHQTFRSDLIQLYPT